jgi:diguanylate cyclase (GGDEF)-like protein
LHEQPEREAFPVVDPDGSPLGMIWRNTFLLRYSKPLQPEILGKKPVTEIMNASPLVVDERLRLEQVSQLVTRRSRARLTDQFIIRLLSQNKPFVACYVDLDNFKPFNDYYGYLRGDEVLLHVAHLLQVVAARQTDFVGHIGASGAILNARDEELSSAEEISERLQMIKREAKAIPGNCLLMPITGGYLNLLEHAKSDASPSLSPALVRVR